MASNVPNAPTSTQYAASAPPAANANHGATSVSLEENNSEECTLTSIGGDTTSIGGVSAESNRSALAEPVLKCLRALEAAENDTEKLAALFLVPKLVKEADCDKSARLHLMKGIGFRFLARMLRSHDTPDGCPKLMYQSVALSVLSCFTGEEEIMTNPSVLFNLPVLLDIIMDADNEIYEENLLIINDAYEILTAIVATEKGRAAFVGNRGVYYLSQVNIKQSFQCDKALTLLLTLLVASHGQKCWAYHCGADDFNNLMMKFCSEFAESMDESKFELCDTIRIILRSFPRSNFDEEEANWLPLLQKGLRDILFSKISKMQRDPALKLVASVIEASDFDWCIETAETANAGDGNRFFLIIVNLACIEVIMHLEEQKLEEVMKHSALVVACFSIIESAVSHMANERISTLEDRQKGQLLAALKNAFSTILKFLQETSMALRDDASLVQDDVEIRHFVCATIRILSAWLAEETMALREDVYEILPFVFTLAHETFEAQKLDKLRSLPGRRSVVGGATDYGEASVAEAVSGGLEDSDSFSASQSATPDVLRFLLPGLCHLVAEDKSRKILLDLKLHETLYTYLSYHWTIFESQKLWLNEQAAAEDDVDLVEPLYMIDNSRFDMVNSKYALTSICNVFMNITVLEREFVSRTPLFFHVLKFIMNSLPKLENSGNSLVLYANFCVLGLLILKHHSNKPKSTDYSIYKFIQAVIK